MIVSHKLSTIFDDSVTTSPEWTWALSRGTGLFPMTRSGSFEFAASTVSVYWRLRLKVDEQAGIHLKAQTLSGTQPVPTSSSELLQGHSMLNSSQVGGRTHPPSFSTEYPTGLPATFLIGGPHRRLLRPFDRSKHTFQHSAVDLAPRMQLEYPQALFLNKSVHRFETPMSAASPSGVAIAPTKATIPPLGVLMFRHTYLLV